MNKQLEEKIEEILKEYRRDCTEYTQEAAMENNPTPDDILIAKLSTLINKCEEDAVREFVGWVVAKKNGYIVLDNIKATNDDVQSYLSERKK
jgi:hypothetical protein